MILKYMTKQDILLSLIIPVYRQEKIILTNIESILSTLSQTNYIFEIIVVIDGQVDKSEQILKKAKLPNVKIITYPKNKGKSFAIREGMGVARGTYVMFLDSGMEIDPVGIAMLMEHMKWYDADIIVGSKRHPASKVHYPLKRRIMSSGYYYLVRFLFGVKVKDTQAGIKVFRREVLSDILPRLVEKRFAGDLEMLVVAKKCDYHKIYEAPINLIYTQDQFSSAVKLKSILEISTDTLAIWYRKNILRFYDKIQQKNH
ncbi:MAG: glycosyltransferase family 2 protein [Pseudomonadales bacterium]|jgi:glycosyltransferase involved in cell wall biosynthesis|nr:glycosyltransferase family 2 protein [Pseudomonadales bacterium]